ncbi:RnfABCDGE type electron transport complex subunit B [bacterium]|nr:RnfABCDGE type electron transport complex subunit B [bacterium]
MLTTILVCVGVLGFLGIAFGVILAGASKKFHVDVDPLVEEVNEALPKVDCGACGYPGCSAYAVAVVTEGVDVSLCVPGGAETAAAVAALMGVEAVSSGEKERAVVLCTGRKGIAAQDFDYVGIEDCRAALFLHGGPKGCKSGCIGFGSCATVCPFDAIVMGEDGLPVISEQRCTACGICVGECPVGIIRVLPSRHRVVLACSNRTDKAKAVKGKCSKGCIKCRMCVKATESGAVTWDKEEGFPAIDHETWTDPEKAMEKCPMSCFVDIPTT